MYKIDEIKPKGLASSGSKEGIIKSIIQYWYSRPDSIELKDDGEDKWKVFQSGKEMVGYQVVKKGSRFTFQSTGE